MSEQIIGVIGAIPEEINGVIALLEDKKEENIGGRSYFTGTINKVKTVVVYSRVGKVAAAATTTCLILNFKITQLIFTGVAGAIHNNLKIGDIVIGDKLIQHDMNAFPLFPTYEIPLLNKTYFEADEYLVKLSNLAIDDMLEASHLKNLISKNDLDLFNIHLPNKYTGVIASGDLFFSNNTDKENLQNNLPNVLCVEMEGAAVAQICYEFEIPFVVIRTISDEANDNSTHDFSQFIKKISNIYGITIIKNIFSSLGNQLK